MNKFNLDKVKDNVQLLKRRLPRLLANQATKYFTDTFKSGSWEGRRWKEVERRKPGTNEYKYPKKRGLSRRTKPILVKSGKLRRAVSMSARVVTFNKIQLLVDLPYAERHNKGLDGMPKRQFMGDSKKLRKMQLILINKEIESTWQA